jgi:hypothetical protein
VIVVVTGDRDHRPTPRELAELHHVLTDECECTVLRSGTCREKMSTFMRTGKGGVDEHVYNHVRDVFAREMWPAPWRERGRSAGMRRNIAMVTGQTGDVDREQLIAPTAGRHAHYVVAFEGGAGTWGCIGVGRRQGIDVWMIGEGWMT